MKPLRYFLFKESVTNYEFIVLAENLLEAVEEAEDYTQYPFSFVKTLYKTEVYSYRTMGIELY